MPFPERLKQARKKTGKTQLKVAQILGIAPNAYQRYELGKSSPNYEKLVILANLYDVSIDWLLGRDDWLRSHEVFFDERQTNLPVCPTCPLCQQ